MDSTLYECNTTVQPNTTYYCTVVATNGAGLHAWAYSDGIRIGNGTLVATPAADAAALFSTEDEYNQPTNDVHGGVDFPAGCLNTTTRFLTGRTPHVPPDLGDNLYFGNYSFFITAIADDGEPFHVDFVAPFFVTLRYPEPAVRPYTPALYLKRCEAGTCTWEDATATCPPGQRNVSDDQVNRVAVFPVCHLTEFALFFERPPVGGPSVPPPGGPNRVSATDPATFPKGWLAVVIGVPALVIVCAVAVCCCCYFKRASPQAAGTWADQLDLPDPDKIEMAVIPEDFDNVYGDAEAERQRNPTPEPDAV